MPNYIKVLQYLSWVFVLLAVIEMSWDVAKKRRGWKESILNLKIFAVGRFLRDPLKLLLSSALLAPLAQLIPYKVPHSISGFVLAVLAADFVYYWEHRAGHEMGLLWSFHSVHHSSEEFNLSTAFRLPWFAVFTNWIFNIALVVAGFDTMQILFATSVVLLYQFWIHTDKIGKLGWFDDVFNSPSNHRVHHGSNKIYHDVNYGGILIIWDKIFGTYRRESEKVVYGLSEPIRTHSAIGVNTVGPRLLWRQMRNAKTLKRAMLLPFLKPGS